MMRQHHASVEAVIWCFDDGCCCGAGVYGTHPVLQRLRFSGPPATIRVLYVHANIGASRGKVMSEQKESAFMALRAVDVGEKIEKKNGLSYLSWAYAVDELLQRDPSATWVFHDLMPCGKGTVMVSCTVTAFGKQMTCHLPVMDHRNRAIQDPDATEVNKAMMRCLTKCIALHGLGLYIYAGEDMPEDAQKDALKSGAQSQKIVVANDPMEDLDFDTFLHLLESCETREAAVIAYTPVKHRLTSKQIGIVTKKIGDKFKKVESK